MSYDTSEMNSWIFQTSSTIVVGNNQSKEPIKVLKKFKRFSDFAWSLRG